MPMPAGVLKIRKAIVASFAALSIAVTSIGSIPVVLPALGMIARASTPTVDLGRTAVNGRVRAAVTDPATGTTYIGGHFTEVGVRTGAVAIVDPPDVGDGDLRAASPEVVGTVVKVFGDDRPGDPGFFIVGRLTAINGAAVGQRPAYRMHLVNGAWVHDSAWDVPAGCHTGNAGFPTDAKWIATPKYLIAGGYAGAAANGTNATGITVIERATAKRLILGPSPCGSTPSLFPSIPALPDLSGCSAQTYCYAAIGDLAYDAATNHVIVHYGYAVGSTTATTWDGIAAYDLTPAAGRRAWVKDLEAGPPPGPPGRRAWVQSLGAISGRFLLRGEFPIDAEITSSRDISRTLLIDAETGTIERRWDADGEQDVATGENIGPAHPCLVDPGDPYTRMATTSDGLFGWTQGVTLCRFRFDAGAFQADGIGTYALTSGNDAALPTTHYAAPGGDSYLLGSNAAVDLTTAQLSDWDPDPAVFTADQRPPSVAVAGGTVVVGGQFSFVRGRHSPGIAALDADMTPITGFASPLRDPNNNEGVFDLALAEGRLLVGGGYLLPGGVRSIVAVDAATGSLDPWQADDTDPVIVDDILVEPDGEFWISGFSDIDAPAAALQRYAPLDAGGALLASPEIECLDAPILEEFGSSEPFCLPEWASRTRIYSMALAEDGSLYLAGVFGAIDGVVRRGLARLAPDGSVSSWNPDLVDAYALAAGQGVHDMATYAIELIADKVVLGGEYARISRNPNGGGFSNRLSPILVFSASSGGLLLPTSPDREPWFPEFPMSELEGPVYDLAHTNAGLFAAMGEEGIGIFDATTLAFDTPGSIAFVNPDWWSRSPGNAVYVLSAPPISGSDPGTGMSAEAISGPTKMVIGGTLSRWRNRVAGNVVRATVAADTRAPSVSSVTAGVQTARSVSPGAITARIYWKGADPGGSGVERYELAMSTSSAPYVSISTSLKSTFSYATVRPGRTYRFRVRAVDFAGNVGAWVYSRRFAPALVQQTSSAVRFSTGWSTLTSSGYSGGSTRIRGAKNASATYTFTGQAVSLVSTMTRSRGKARIYVDGKFQSDINLYSATTQYRRAVWAKAWTTSGTHTVKIVVLGTSGHPSVDVDAFVVYR